MVPHFSLCMCVWHVCLCRGQRRHQHLTQLPSPYSLETGALLEPGAWQVFLNLLFFSGGSGGWKARLAGQASPSNPASARSHSSLPGSQVHKALPSYLLEYQRSQVLMLLKCSQPMSHVHEPTWWLLVNKRLFSNETFVKYTYSSVVVQKDLFSLQNALS